MFTRKSISIIFSVLFLIVMTTGNASARSLNSAPSPATPLLTSQNFTVTTGTTDCASVTQIPVTECNALVALYNSTNGANWYTNIGWLQTNTPCSWYGVTCGSSHVTQLALGDNQLSGNIPDLSSLSNLQDLYLYSNQLSGIIPSQLGNLTNLIGLYLYSNQLSGTIPSQLGNLTNLTYLGLNNNQLSGTIPYQLGSLTNLKYLYLYSNQLTGSIPYQLGNLTNLQFLDLYNNLLYGSIPYQLGSLTNLTDLGLGMNQLSGGIPTQLGSLSKLTYLGLNNNQLNGSIPYQLGSLSNLKYLYLYTNQLSGSIPSQLGSLTNLIGLYLYSNQLSGSLPLSLENLTHLQYFYFYSTSLCKPSDAAFQTWLSSIPYVSGTSLCISVNVSVGGTNQGTYNLPEGSSLRESYAGVNNGPVKIVSTTNPIIASERVAYYNGSAWTSFAELMGLPSNQLTNTYVMPWYNNVDLNSQLRFGNVGSSSTTIKVYVAGVVQGSYTLAPSQSTRISYVGLNNGPVVVQSSGDVPIIASERVAYTPDGGTTWTSFSELMGLPSYQLTTTYVMPWYNNVDLNSQLRFGNVGSSSTTITVYVAGVVQGSYTLAPSQSTRISYTGLNNGPVVVQSSGGVPIIASERVAYTPDGGTTWTSFSELMGLPSSQLTTKYVMPIYDNVDVNDQLRFGNVGSSSTTVTVTVAGVVQGSYALAPYQSTRISYTGLNAGPVELQSSGGVPIIASKRVAYYNGSAWTSFAEMMGLPASQLTTSYVMPWYNDVDLNSQLRFGVP